MFKNLIITILLMLTAWQVYQIDYLNRNIDEIITELDRQQNEDVAIEASLKQWERLIMMTEANGWDEND